MTKLNDQDQQDDGDGFRDVAKLASKGQHQCKKQAGSRYIVHQLCEPVAQENEMPNDRFRSSSSSFL